MSSRSSRNTPVVILVALFLLGVGVWASSPIFWPQHQYSDPTAPGTLGGVMEYFASGVAPDADTLDGISST